MIWATFVLILVSYGGVGLKHGRKLLKSKKKDVNTSIASFNEGRDWFLNWKWLASAGSE